MYVMKSKGSRIDSSSTPMFFIVLSEENSSVVLFQHFVSYLLQRI